MFQYYAIFFLIMNLLGFLTMRIDKKCARRGLRRIPEKVLFGIAILTGCFGSYIGMQLCHHKTRHALFSVGLPILMLLHSALLVYLLIILS